MLQKISYSNKYCSFELCIQTILEKNVPLFPQKIVGNTALHLWNEWHYNLIFY